MSGPNSKPEIGLQTYRTPPTFLAALCRRLGKQHVDFDLACSPHNCVGVSGGFVYPAVDALTQDWSEVALAFEDGLSFCNPEFAQSGAFAAKAAAHAPSRGHRMVLLVPVALGTRWWKQYVHMQAVVLSVGRMKFLLPDGTPMATAINRDVATLVYGAAPENLGCGKSGWYPLEDHRTW